jgi:hypothetical protein
MVPLESYHSHNTLQRRYVILSCVCAVLSLRLVARPAVLHTVDMAARVTWHDTWDTVSEKMASLNVRTKNRCGSGLPRRQSTT